jgi:sugar (pentulose or hexulose) kinase
MKILSVDFGTSSVKMAVLNEKEEILAETKVEYAYEVIDRLKIQIDPEIVYSAFLKGLAAFQSHLKEIELLVPCVFAPVFIHMDKEGNALHPAIIHLDRRSYSQSRFALKAVGKKMFLEISGNLPFAGGISCTSMLWYKDNCPELYARTYKLGHMNTFLQRRLVGKWLIDPSNASFTGLYETRKMGGWSEMICGALGIDRNLLPEIVPSMSFAGKLCREAALATGLKEGLPVVMGANDTTSAAFGAGAVNPGDILNISGSNEIITVTTDDPVPHEKYYIRSSMEPGKWLFLAITVGGFALEWFRKEFYSEMDKGKFYGEYLTNFVKTHTETDVKFKPYLAGDRHSLGKKKGAFTGLTFESTREDLLLALLVGTYEPVFNTINILKKRMRLNPHIFWTGGMVSEAYQDFKRRVFKGFDFNMRRECSTLGNLKVALILTGRK